jgi:hypothetical protein
MSKALFTPSSDLGWLLRRRRMRDKAPRYPFPKALALS